MEGFRRALSAELLKSRRSRIPWLLAAGFTLAPLVGGLLMFILKDPERARRLGLLGLKAQLTAGSADWPTFLGLLGQALAVGGGFLFALLTSWVFGREFVDRTVRGLLAVPTPRAATVAAKMTTVAIWCAGMTAWVLVVGLGVGALVGLPGLDAEVLLSGIGTALLAALLITGLQAGAALFAGIGHGYIAPMAWTLLVVFAAQVLAVLGFGSWFPWSVPALLTGAAGPEGEALTPASWAIVLAAIGLLVALTFRWWQRADQTT